jgi:hypothetical protein|tara:strand:+ start:48 stop:269 length:222 start_codon:yes stop_codon:yes gene_type:complete
MQFKQYEDGSCDWNFSDQEIETLKKKKKFTLSASDLKNLCNDLVAIASAFQNNFPKNVQNQQSDGTGMDLSGK